MRVFTQNWIAWTGAACALVAAGYAALRLTAAMPPDGGVIVYPLTLVYNYSALPASIVVVLGALTALFFWVPQAIVRGPHHRRDGVLVAVALAAAGLAIWAALPLGGLIYRELASAPAAGRTLHLGVRVAADSDLNAYVLCDCPGLACACRYFDDASLDDLDVLPTLTVDADQRVRVEVAGRVLYDQTP